MTSKSEFDTSCSIDGAATVGYAYDEQSTPPAIGADTTIRAGTIVYDDVVTGGNYV